MRSSSTSAGLLLVTLAGVALFCRGFFPVKPLLPGFAESHLPPNEEPHFSRLVFILVDALRSDFAFGSGHQMPFVNSIVESGHGLGFTALAQAPTVTLPRLKALTTGSNPTFLDAILNIAEDSSSAVLENVDSWVRQLAKGPRKKRMMFVGDDTWLRIFPREWFEWAEGVSSFFVSDTITVDTNVTRHLDRLLAPSPSAPFDVLILHYLGLDHVGHLGGPESLLMGPKQQEMDAVVKSVFDYLQEQDRRDGESSLMVLVGDHGMTENGNHGGSTEGETHAALLIAAPSHEPIEPPPSPRFSSPYSQHMLVNQIDLVPTLAMLFGVGMPTNSMGKLIMPVMDAYYPGDLTLALKANVEQMKRVLEVASPGATKQLLARVHRLWAEAGVDSPDEEAVMSEFLNLAQDRLMTTFGDYHLLPMAAGLFLLLGSVIATWRLARGTWRYQRDWADSAAVGLAMLVYLATFFATSFIEEEHEFWFFFTNTMLLVLWWMPSTTLVGRAGYAMAALAVRIMRSWSFNGQKDVPNLSITAYLATAPRLTHALTLLTCVYLTLSPLKLLYRYAHMLSRRNNPHRPVQELAVRAFTFATLSVLILLSGGLLYLFKSLSSGTSVWWLGPFGLGGPVELARAVMALGGSGWLVARVAKVVDPVAAGIYDDLQLSSITILLASLTRPTNLPLFILLQWQLGLLERVQSALPPLTFSAIIIALQHVSFFAFGGSNSLATIDLSQAYNGLTSYSMPLVSLQTFASNFAGPIFWACAVGSRLYPWPPWIIAVPTASATTHFLITTLFHSLSFLTLAASATHFRSHLFVWTVFSPALLYKGVWTLLVHWVVGVGLAALQ